jgi:pyridoxamine 5'-phosphate oxidase
VALLFSWLELNRQVRIQGTAVTLSAAATLRYFLGRERGSQIGAWLNQSSDVIGSRQLLRAKLAQIKERFRGGQIPLPDAWGGYRIRPDRFEFWQGRPDGLHDRWRYRQEEKEWAIARLMP